jgi:hypothetical protein
MRLDVEQQGFSRQDLPYEDGPLTFECGQQVHVNSKLNKSQKNLHLLSDWRLCFDIHNSKEIFSIVCKNNFINNVIFV